MHKSLALMLAYKLLTLMPHWIRGSLVGGHQLLWKKRMEQRLESRSSRVQHKGRVLSRIYLLTWLYKTICLFWGDNRRKIAGNMRTLNGSVTIVMLKIDNPNVAGIAKSWLTWGRFLIISLDIRFNTIYNIYWTHVTIELSIHTTIICRRAHWTRHSWY